MTLIVVTEVMWDRVKLANDVTFKRYVSSNSTNNLRGGVLTYGEQ